MCILALLKHSQLPRQIYVYDNLTDVKTDQHFALWHKLYQKGLISQVTFTTKESTFGSFSKVVTSNLFAQQHSQDINKNSYDFLVLLDNDVIVTPGWDSVLRQAWGDVARYGLKDVKIITQLPGGIKESKEISRNIAGVKSKIGKFGGSGLWCVRTDFFEKIGLLQVKNFIGSTKRYDQSYWYLTEVSTAGKPYILGLHRKLGIHCGSLSYSVCNILNSKRGQTSPNLEKVEGDTDRYIEGLSFDEFYDAVSGDEVLTKEW